MYWLFALILTTAAALLIVTIFGCFVVMKRADEHDGQYWDDNL